MEYVPYRASLRRAYMCSPIYAQRIQVPWNDVKTDVLYLNIQHENATRSVAVYPSQLALTDA
jgi:hypothetical protein